MSRTKGSFQTPNNYELGKRRPLDARQLVNSVDDLTLESTWTKCKNNDGSLFNNAYNGMIVAVAEDASLYVLKDRENLTSLENGWVRIGENSGVAANSDTVVFETSIYKLPALGNANTLYIVNSNIFYWDKIKYVRLTSDWQDIEVINGGGANFIKQKHSIDYSPDQKNGLE